MSDPQIVRNRTITWQDPMITATDASGKLYAHGITTCLLDRAEKLLQKG